MLQIFLGLSYYQLYYESNSQSYFQKFPFLEYGFNNDANYSINFSNPNTDFVFGFATQIEILEIDKHKNSSEYCHGQQRLSKIQHFISNSSAIHGIISFKSSLIPYIFACSKSYSITIGFDYSNGKNHLDFRCQGALTYTLIFFICISVYTLLFIIYIIYCKIRQIDFLDLRFMIPFVLLFIFCIVHDVFMYEFFNSQKDMEYFNRWFSDQNRDSEIIPIRTKFLSLISISLCSACVYLISLFKYYFFNMSSTFKIMISLLFFPVIVLPTHFALQLIENNIGVSIAIVLLFASFTAAAILIPPILSITKAGIIVFLLGVFITSSLGCVMMNATQERLSTHGLALILSHLSMLTQAFSLACFSLAIFYFKDFKEPIVSHNNLIIRKESSYTFITDSYDNINKAAEM